jgi:N-acetylated-alpha-linked acidic dipeptidase
LGSGSDYTVFLQHLGVPSTDIGSTGSYGVYHSAFDNFQWFKQFADPNFLYEQQMARLFGLETLRMANADVLPYDYKAYGEEVNAYLAQARKKAESEFGAQAPSFTSVEESARRFEKAGEQMWARQQNQLTDVAAMNQTLTKTERGLLLPEGLPDRPWYRHAIYAPGMHTGYAAVVIPGVNEAIERHDLAELNRELEALAEALNGAAQVLESH